MGSMMSRTMTSCSPVAGMPERGLSVRGFIDGIARFAKALSERFAKGLKIFDDEKSHGCLEYKNYCCMISARQEGKARDGALQCFAEAFDIGWLTVTLG